MNARQATLELLGSRSNDATVCPSEVARALVASTDAKTAAADWRSLMPAVHDAIDTLVAEGSIQLSWKGRKLEKRAGPYRIRRLI